MSPQKPTEPIGLLLNLKKRKLFLTSDDTDNYDYLLFGNFDGISIRPVHNWYALAPTLTMDEDAANLTGEYIHLQDAPYISTYVLKLLFPQSISPSCLGCYNYDFWRSSGDPGQKEKLYKNQPCPFFSIIMMNVSHAVAAHYSVQEQGTSKLFEYISKEVKDQIGSDFPFLNCGLFESFGYYDYIMLVRAPSFQMILKLGDTLKRLRFEGGPAISACYTILGIDNWTKNDGALPTEYCRAFKDAVKGVERIEITLQFRPGCSGSKLIQLLRADNLEILDRRSHGNADALLVLEGDQLPKLLPQYLKNGHLNPGCPAYSANILSKSTEFLFVPRSLPSSGPLPEDNPPGENTDLLPGQYSAIFQRFKEMRLKEQKSQRLTTAMRQTVLRYRNLASCDHAFELKYFLKPIFDSLFENMNRTMTLIDDITERRKVKENLDLEWEQAHYWNELERALRAFRESVGGFLSDIALSDRYFIEDSQLRHPPIGSATKLIFVYNLLVKRVAERLNQEKCQYSFLVKSGGSDDVDVSNLFNFLPLNKPGEANHSEDCLLVIELPERLLYSPQGSLFAILHETFHILGNRNRELRLQEMEAAAADSFAWLLYSVLQRPEGLFKMSFDPDAMDNHEEIKILEQLCAQEMEAFRSGVSQELFQALQKEIGDPSSLELFSRTIVDRLIHAAKQCLTLDFQCKNQLFHKVYLLLHQTYQKIAESFFAHDNRYVELGLYIRLMRLFRGNNTQIPPYDEHMDQYAFEVLWNLFELAGGNMVDFPLELVDDQENRQNLIKFIQQENNRIESVISNCFTAMNEAFSDCMAIKILNMPLEDYCVCHCLMQEGTVSSILAASDDTVLRIGCVLQYAYGISECFSEEEKKKISDKVQSLNDAHAFITQLDANILIEQLEVLIRTCNYGYGDMQTKNHVVKYLAGTVDVAAQEAQKYAGDILKDIQKIYNCWDPADIAHFQRTTLDQWLVIANLQQHQNGGTK